MSDEIETADFRQMQAQVMALQCSLTALIGSVAHHVPDLRAVLEQGRDATDHVINTAAIKAGSKAPEGFFREVMEMTEMIWGPVKKRNQPKHDR